MNFKTLLTIASIAKTVSIYIPHIRFTVDLLKQYNHSLAKAGGEPVGTQSRNAGFVYLIKDITEGERFKLGYRANHPRKDSRLRTELGANGEFVLIIPAKNAKELEKSFRNTFAKGTSKSDWFPLNNNERKAIQVLSAVVGLIGGDDLGQSPVNQEIIQLAKELIAKIRTLAETLKEESSVEDKPEEEGKPSETAPDIEDFSALPDLDWNWESISTKDYRALPKLKGREAYLTVIRDNNAKVGKIFLDDHPAKSVDVALAEQWCRFRLEIVLILKVDDRKTAQRDLAPSSSDRGANDWVAVSDEALSGIKQFARSAWYGGSNYVDPKKHWGLQTLPSKRHMSLRKMKGRKGYVCVIQGRRRGNRYKIWRTHLPKDTDGLFGMAAQLNNPHDALHARNRVRFGSIIRSEYAESFEKFLKERYAKFRRKYFIYELADWYKLNPAQLQEIRSLGQ